MRRIVGAVLVLFFTFNITFAYAADAPGFPSTPGGIQLPSSATATPNASQQQGNPSPLPYSSTVAPDLSQQQGNLSQEQQKAVQEGIQQKGLTPEAVESLKSAPEFQGLTPEDVTKGREMMQKKEGEKNTLEKKEPEKKGPEKKEPEKEVVEKTEETKELFDLNAKKSGNKEPGVPEKNGTEAVTSGSLFDRYRIVSPYQDINTNLKPFGYDFFLTASSHGMTPRKDIPVSADYVVGPGDEVKVQLWGRVNGQFNLVIDKDGNISLPSMGPIRVAGMTYEQMAKYLIEQSEKIIGANINVTMGSLKTIQVFVLGEVVKPGSYAIDSFSTIVSAIIAAGGPTGIGSLRKVELKRNNKTIVTMDLYDFLLNGNKSKDMVLQAGDIIFVPTVGPLVGVAGNVKRPAIYELRDKTDLQNLFDLAGGIIPTAYTQQIQVERVIKGERQVVIDINDKNLSKSKDFMLQDADLVKIFPIMDRDVNSVYLIGNVKRPGKYEYKPGMRVSDIIRDGSEVLKETYYDYALIKRQKLPDMSTELVPFDIGKVLFNKDASNNIELLPHDNIYVFSKWFFKLKPVVSITGEVKHAGHFSLADNTTVKDVILAAGDLTMDAYLKKAELIRINHKREFSTIYFDVAKAMAGDPAENLMIQDEDRIVIHSIWENKWKEFVSVSGEVKKRLNTELTQGMTVADLVFKAGGLTRDTYLDEAELYRTDWRTKEITLKRINLKKALAGDPENNIPLKDFDNLVVHSVWEKLYKKTVTINGDVSRPGQYQYAENMTVGDLIFTAGNVLESAYLGDAEITSQVLENGKSIKIEHKDINLQKALNGDPENNVCLKPYDTLVVKRIQDWGTSGIVQITGEVRFPGKYVIGKGERMSSLIERAGGYTDKAFLRAAVFTRTNVQKMQQQNLTEMIRRLEMELSASSAVRASTISSPEEAQAKQIEVQQQHQFIDSLKNVKTTGRMTIVFTPVNILKGSENDIQLQDGDSLYFPQNTNVVNVSGAVMNQGSYIYSGGKSYKDYIAMAGGFSNYADESDVYVLKADGSAQKLSSGFSWNPFKSNPENGKEIESGDTIVVPQELERTAWLRDVKDITQVLANVAITAGVVLLVK